METKVCTKCKRELTVDSFGKRHVGKNGLAPVCKECHKQHREEDKTAIAERSKQYRENNREIVAECNKQWRQNNRELVAGHSKQYREDNREILAEYIKQWRLDNDEYMKQYRVDNKAVIVKQMKKYQQEHLEEFRVNNQAREARKRLLPSTLTAQQWENIKECFDGKCAYCGQKLPLTQEHVVPVTKGGGYTHNNIICACQSCNSSKGNRDFKTWFGKHEYYSEEREIKILKHLNYTEEIGSWNYES